METRDMFFFLPAYMSTFKSSPRLGNPGTLPETNMETQKGPTKTRVLLKGGYIGLHVNLGECIRYNSEL